MNAKSYKEKLDELSKDASVSNELGLEVLVDMLVKAKIIKKEVYDKTLKEKKEVFFKRAEKLRVELMDFLKQMHDQFLDDKFNDPNSQSGNA
jgi:hypothetical protein